MIGVVINPHAGGNRGDDGRLARLQQILGASGVAVAPASLSDLDRVVHEIKGRGVDVLAVCGGDGSFFRTLSAAARAYGPESLPRFLPLRGGSMNTIARSVGCRRGRPESVLAQVVAELRAGGRIDSTERQLMVINGDSFGFMSGAGAVVNFLQAYYGRAGRGPVAAASLFGRALLSAALRDGFAQQLLSGIDAEIKSDDQRLAQRHFNFVYASTINEIGLGIQVTYRGDRTPGHFHLIAADIRPTQALARVHRLRRGRPLDLPTVYDNVARSVRIEFERPTHYMIDGDVLPPVQRLDLSSGPRLTILR